MKPEINYKKKAVKVHKYVEIKQNATKQLLGQQRSQRRNQKIPGDK